MGPSPAAASADYPWGWSAEHLKEVLRGMDQGWASGNWWAAANPSVADDEHYQAWWARYLRAAASPSMGRGALGPERRPRHPPPAG